MMEDRYRALLKEVWGYDDFRGIQREIIESIGAGRDTLGLMPTGGGKSITFQVPALAAEGVCIVVTPLIALMKDQVQNLRLRGIKATAVYSGLTHEEILVALENCILGDYKFLYVSPERLGTELFQTKLRHMNVSFITVDEAHCISQWGYDFRPSYLKIADIRKLVPHAAVLALTATATPEVVKDIQSRLGFAQENAFRMSFERKNLAYVVRRTDNKEDELLHILQHFPGSAIVYTRNRKGTKEVASLLCQHDISALHYHAGLSNAEKDLRQHSWQTGETRVMVATNAFGMGIDKPDVRLVVHMELPDSPEAYFQEAGRAGRDGQLAYAVLLYNKGDKVKLKRRIPDTFPDKAFIRQIYEELSYFFQLPMGTGYGVTYEFNRDEFCRNFKHFPVPVDSALRLLTRAGYIQYTDEQENASRLIFLVRRDELYRLSGETSQLDSLIQAVLRAYGGVFSDYVTIEESLLAHILGITNDLVYNGLKALSASRIIHYIPRKKTPYITYTQRREEADRLVIPSEIYEKRKAQYEGRIEAMVSYAENDNVCRSRQLLRYFGEQNDHNCLRCDVCLSAVANGLRRGEYDEVRRAIGTLLADGQPHAVAELNLPSISRSRLDKAVSQLIAEEEVGLVDGMLVQV